MHIRFKVGQIVKSKSKRVRGVVIEYDTTYYRSESAYQLLSHPYGLKNKPWYLILLDGSYCSIYLPEEDLFPDLSGKEVSNPILNEHLPIYANGMYFESEKHIKEIHINKNDFIIRRIK